MGWWPGTVVAISQGWTGLGGIRSRGRERKGVFPQIGIVKVYVLVSVMFL